MANEGATGGFIHATPANNDKLPVVRSIFDFSAEALGELKTWLEQNPPAIPVTQVIGYTTNAQSVLVSNSGSQTIPSGGIHILSWDTTVFDKPAGGQHSTSSNTSRLTCIVAGRYLVSAMVPFASGAALGTFRDMTLYKNGVSLQLFMQVPPVNGMTTGMVATFPPQDLAVGDYVELEVDHDAGVNLTVSTDARFSMTRIA